MTTAKDSIYANPLGEIGAFQFDENVARVFPDMIQRSVPGYATVITAIGLLAGQYARPGSNCYDLGCSLGAATMAMQSCLDGRSCRLVAVDNSPAMVAECKKNLAGLTAGDPAIELLCADIRSIPIENASVVVLNFTLQFIPPEDRLVLLHKINLGMLPGGILILSEKLRSEDDKLDGLLTHMHHQFKKGQGYSDLEISQKRTALEKVLIPETFDTHQQRLHKAGFHSVQLWFQYFNFASLLAIK